MNCVASRKVWQGFKPRISEPFTLRDLVEDYLHTKYDCKYSNSKETPKRGHELYLDKLKCIKDFICGEPNNEDAPEKRPYHINSHQRYFRFPSRHYLIWEAAQKLKALEGQTFKDFEELRKKVKETGCKGFGDTTIYDFSLRYGWHLTPRLEPTEYVYVHSEPKKSVEYLISKGYMNADYDYRIPFEAFPPEIKDSGMNATDVEHFLCIYKTFIENSPKK